MAVHQIGKLKYHTFASFDDLGVEHALITRHGGVSTEPWATLNIASTVGDNKDHVVENLNRVFQTFNIDRQNTYDVWQIHSNRVVCTSSPRKENVLHQQADAILTDQQGLALIMRFADCVPILLFDPYKKVVGIVHAGWKGTISKIVFNAVQTMSKQYGSNPSDIRAGIGPSIACHHYEIGQDVIQEIRNSMPEDASDLLISRDGSTNFDLWAANQKFLERAGVRKIENIGLCTACNTKDWFSHRGEHGKSGRFGVYIRL